MIQLIPQLRILLACQPIDFRNGIDGLAAICKRELWEDFSADVRLFLKGTPPHRRDTILCAKISLAMVNCVRSILRPLTSQQDALEWQSPPARALVTTASWRRSARTGWAKSGSLWAPL